MIKTMEDYLLNMERKRDVIKSLRARIAELESMLVSRTKEVDDGITRYNKSVSKQQKIIAELEKERDGKAITLAYGFAGLLTSLKEPITFSEKHWATPAADMAAGLILSNNLKGDCDFDGFVYFDYEKALKEQGE